MLRKTELLRKHMMDKTFIKFVLLMNLSAINVGVTGFSIVRFHDSIPAIAVIVFAALNIEMILIMLLLNALEGKK